MNLFKKFFIHVFVLGFLLVPIFSFAIDTEIVSPKSPLATLSPEAKVLPINITLSNAKIISQEGNNIKISFDIKNGKNVQVGVKYGLRVLKLDSKNKFNIVDEKVYDESLTLAEDSSISREINYENSILESGDYSLMVIASGAKSSSSASAFLGNVKLVTNSNIKNIIDISLSSCLLKVKDDKSKKTYSINSKVDIDPSESLILTCTAMNTDTKTVTVTPIYKTTDAILFGGDSLQQEGGGITPITFKSKEKKTFSVTLPKVNKPGAYKIKFQLNNESVTSNTLDIYYMTRGISATIQNLILDKDYYNKDDQANLSLMWSTSFNNYVRGKNENNVSFDTTMNLSMTNDKGEACITPINQVIVPDYIKNKNEFSIPVTKKCINPKVSITLSDKDGNVLDQKDFNATTSSLSSKTLNTKTTIIIIIVILLILALGFFMSKKKSNLPVSVILGFVMLVGWGSVTEKALALQATVLLSADDTTISYFSSGTNLNNGTTLHWSVTNFTSSPTCSLYANGQEIMTNVSPLGNYSTGTLLTTTTYVVSCGLPGGSKPVSSNPVTIIVAPGVIFNVSPLSVPSGSLIDVSWSAYNATSCELKKIEGGQTTVTSVPLENTTNPIITGLTIFGISCSNLYTEFVTSFITVMATPAIPIDCGPGMEWNGTDCVSTVVNPPANPINGICGISNMPVCSSGNIGNIENPTNNINGPWIWQCLGLYGGINSPVCYSENSPGVCGASEDEPCLLGSPSNVVFGSNETTWVCQSPNGGINASCSSTIINNPDDGDDNNPNTNNPACDDGIDNDHDELIDMQDQGCFNSKDNSESGLIYMEV